MTVAVTAPSRLGEGQWFHPSRLWLEAHELIAYSWEAFRKWVTSRASGFDIVDAAVTPGLFDVSNEQAEGIHPTHMLSRLTELIEAHAGLTTVVDRTWQRAVILDSGEAATAARLGSAPAHRAKANRMSPAGVSMFYGADDNDTAFAEIGSPTGVRILYGTWRPVRPLRLVDLVELPAAPSFFDWEHASERDGISSLGSFATDLSAPVGTAAGAAGEYVPTQAFTEYLRRHLAGLDGVTYRSSQTGEPSCVLFVDNAECVAPGGAGTLELTGYSDAEV